MERAAVRPTRHWAIADYFQRTSENILILRRVLRPRRICDIYDLFAPCINLLTYLLDAPRSGEPPRISGPNLPRKN